MEVWAQFFLNVAGIVVGGTVMFGVFSLTMKYFVKKALRYAIDEETKKNVETWLKTWAKKSVKEVLKDDEILVGVLGYFLRGETPEKTETKKDKKIDKTIF